MTDDKTRILTAEEMARVAAAGPLVQPRTARNPAAAKPASEPPRVVGDKIVFFCPNGHKIVVDRGWAGRRGTCSKAGCNAAVVIPAPPGAEPPSELVPPPADGVPGEPPDADAAGAEAGVPPPPPGSEPGGDVPPAAPPPDLPVGGWDLDAASARAAGEVPADVGFDPGAAAAGWTIDIDEIEHPTARLVARLWLERAHGGIVEVHLSGGSVIMPEWYDPRWSGGSHALFAAQAADGTVTLTAVAWDQIQRVVVRQVQGTPDGMFEG